MNRRKFGLLALAGVAAIAGSYGAEAAVSTEKSALGPVLSVVSRPVADLAVRRIDYDEGQSAYDAAGVTGAEVFVDPANPSMVVVIQRFPSVKAANDFLQNPILRATMTRAGVTAPLMIILAATG